MLPNQANIIASTVYTRKFSNRIPVANPFGGAGSLVYVLRSPYDAIEQFHSIEITYFINCYF